MKYWLAAIIIIGSAVTASGAGKGPEIKILDDKISVTAEAVPVGRLLKLFDRATGMESRVPPELANRNISVSFSELSFDEAVRKIFQGQPFDYVVLGGQGIVITGMSQALTGAEPVPAFNPPAPQAFEQPFVQDIQPVMPPQPVQPPVMPVQPPGTVPAQQQPAVIQTPFGPIPNPRANQPPAGTMVVPGASMQPGMFPGGVGGAPAGNPSVPPQNELFGNTPIFQNPGTPVQTQPQRR